MGTEFTGGHLILNPETNRIVVRRDIRVHENSSPLRKQVNVVYNKNRLIVETALKGPNTSEWENAINKELQNME